MGRTCSTYRTIQKANRVLRESIDRKRPLGRLKRRWEDNIKMDLREVGCDVGDWINLLQHRDQWRAYVRMVINLLEFLKSHLVMFC